MTAAEWTEYAENTKRIQKSVIPSSSVTAQTVAADGLMLSQQNHAGITETAARAYTAAGMTLTRTDGRGNTTTIRTDLAGRAVSVTDAAGNETVTQYDARFDLAAVVTDALGNTVCAGYDARGRKTAEWGTGTQPLLLGYDEAGRLVSLTTFRAAQEETSRKTPLAARTATPPPGAMTKPRGWKRAKRMPTERTWTKPGTPSTGLPRKRTPAAS